MRPLGVEGMLVLRKGELRRALPPAFPTHAGRTWSFEPGLAFPQAQVTPSDITKFINNNWGWRAC